MIINANPIRRQPADQKLPPHKPPYHPKGGLIGININVNTCNNDMKGNVDENNTNYD